MFARRALRLFIVCLVGLGLLAQPLGALASACGGAAGKAPRACCGCCAAARLEQSAKPSCCRKRESAAVVRRGCCVGRPIAKSVNLQLSAQAGLHNCCCSGSSDPVPSVPAPARPAGAQNELLLLAQLAPADAWTIIVGADAAGFGLHGLAPPPLAGRELLPRLCVWRI